MSTVVTIPLWLLMIPILISVAALTWVSVALLLRLVGRLHRSGTAPEASGTIRITTQGLAELELRAAQYSGYWTGDAASLLGINTRWISRLLSAGELKYVVTKGGVKWVRADSILAMLIRMGIRPEAEEPVETEQEATEESITAPPADTVMAVAEQAETAKETAVVVDANVAPSSVSAPLQETSAPVVQDAKTASTPDSRSAHAFSRYFGGYNAYYVDNASTALPDLRAALVALDIPFAEWGALPLNIRQRIRRERAHGSGNRKGEQQ